MPVYTCTTAQSTLSADIKAALAAEMTRIHSTVNHVPGTYVNVVFHELAPEDVYTDGRPAQPLLINGWVRTGHPEAQTSQLVAEIAAAATRVTGIPADRILVVIQNSPAHFAIEGGRVLPAPGEEQAWLRAQQEAK
ncbi:tautomerase family protein [Mycolicibacterium vaccae]|uniref:4-oxalocrotonate tautomerase n=1 Tax=Mycolicibacterium vaccae ATCC 25954 TaxID=1194972 RepID=K0V7A6_MYCVA|nr:tautomerase family protein [Mycolicibacterium vaccae]ANI41803.1 tautomerase [Mycolicibacterium vaccae 95051]EJZ06899.1 4-oxalocrotonate tautomerase [Mycolicibacterium vaccae ATCC 25954]MCV7059573.1 tautomerase [Mycolicibacterium vaccae]